MAAIVAQPLSCESIWFDKWRCDDAERMYQEKLAGTCSVCTSNNKPQSTLVTEIAKAREQIQNSLRSGATMSDNVYCERIEALEQENKGLTKVTQDLQKMIKLLEDRVKAIELQGGSTTCAAPAKPAAVDEDDDDDFELFGSDDEEEDEAAEKLKEERIKAYQAKKSNKPVIIAKSNLILDIKPWDDETDMKALEDCVRSIEMEGLKWGASKLVAIAYGVRKLSISAVIVDDLVSTDDLEEKIVAFEDYIQSMDIAAFNKV